MDVRWSSSDRTQGAWTNPCSTSKTNDSWENEGLVENDVLDHQLHLRAGENELHGVKGQVETCSCIFLKAEPHTISKPHTKIPTTTILHKINSQHKGGNLMSVSPRARRATTHAYVGWPSLIKFPNHVQRFQQQQYYTT